MKTETAKEVIRLMLKMTNAKFKENYQYKTYETESDVVFAAYSRSKFPPCAWVTIGKDVNTISIGYDLCFYRKGPYECMLEGICIKYTTDEGLNGAGLTFVMRDIDEQCGVICAEYRIGFIDEDNFDSIFFEFSSWIGDDNYELYESFIELVQNSMKQDSLMMPVDLRTLMNFHDSGNF